MEVNRYVSERLLSLIARYNPNVSRLIQEDPTKREEVLARIENGVRAVAYGLPADFGDIVWEKIEDALGVVLGVPSGGSAVPAVEVAGAIIERIILAPAEKKYHKTIGKSHPTLSKVLRAYQYFTEIPGLDTILSVIPEKSIVAVGAFIYDIYRITQEAKRYVRLTEPKDYVEELYGKRGVEGYGGKPHPVRPAIPYTTT